MPRTRILKEFWIDLELNIEKREYTVTVDDEKRTITLDPDKELVILPKDEFSFDVLNRPIHMLEERDGTLCYEVPDMETIRLVAKDDDVEIIEFLTGIITFEEYDIVSREKLICAAIDKSNELLSRAEARVAEMRSQIQDLVEKLHSLGK